MEGNLNNAKTIRLFLHFVCPIIYKKCKDDAYNWSFNQIPIIFMHRYPNPNCLFKT